MVSALHYSISNKPRINWTATQEKSLANDYPFTVAQETDDEYVARSYLQFLWLPESIMPLKLLVPSLLRVSSDPSEHHALHAYLKPLLQTARTASRKYHIELPQILSDGGGAGEIEETMMWYALSYEKADDDLWNRTSAIREGPWEDEKWRTRWLERMERREFQIQILLYFLKLSLPGPPPPPLSPIKQKGKRGHKEPQGAEPPPEDCLEIFMDRLSMWQLMDGLENTSKAGSNESLDWMQTFFESTVKLQFEERLPDMCSLMRSKLFPNSPFSNSSGPSSPSSSRATSPDIPQPLARGTTRQSSPALSSTSSKASRPLVRNRSRSLSVSLAQERIERERSVTAGPSKKRILNREVSMSRAFKPKSRPVQDEPARKRASLQSEAAKKEPKPRDEGVLLVEATPTKPTLGRSQSKFAFGAHSQSNMFPASVLVDEADDEEEWLLPGSSSPDILLLGPGRRVEDAESVGIAMDHTPTKRSRLR